MIKTEFDVLVKNTYKGSGVFVARNFHRGEIVVIGK